MTAQRMIGVILDADSLGQEVELSPITSLVDDWHIFPGTRADETASRIQDATLVLSNKVLLDRARLEPASKLQFISIMATGTDNVDLPFAREQGIRVSNAVAYATASVVQHCLSLILALSTSLPRYLEAVRSGAWQRSSSFCLLDHPITEIAGKTLGILGYGELGSQVARAAMSLGMQILISARPGEPTSGDRLAFPELLPRVDYLSLHCPLTPHTHQIINDESLALMKPSSFLINTARGGLVDSAALLRALDTGKLKGAAVDVFTQEPAKPAEPLLAHRKNLLVTPHIAWAAVESRQRLIQQMRENIEGFLAGAAPRRVA